MAGISSQYPTVSASVSLAIIVHYLTLVVDILKLNIVWIIAVIVDCNWDLILTFLHINFDKGTVPWAVESWTPSLVSIVIINGAAGMWLDVAVDRRAGVLCGVSGCLGTGGGDWWREEEYLWCLAIAIHISAWLANSSYSWGFQRSTASYSHCKNFC